MQVSVLLLIDHILIPELTGWDDQGKSCTADNYRRGFLNDWEIKDWLYQNASPVSNRYSAFELGA